MFPLIPFLPLGSKPRQNVGIVLVSCYFRTKRHASVGISGIVEIANASMKAIDIMLPFTGVC